MKHSFISLSFFVWLLLFATTVAAQDAPVLKGTVRYASGDPAEGALVSLAEDPTTQVVTDPYGRFALPALRGQHLVVVDAANRRLDVAVDADEMFLTLKAQDVQVPIGFNQQRSWIATTGAIDLVTFDDLDESAVINPENALYGKLPGLTVLQNGFLPPAAATLFVRGRETMTNAAPLVLVDGFERPMSSVTLEEIESVAVLKDAGAVAMYGQRGANGVVLVTTKRGRSTGGLNVSATMETGMTDPIGMPEFVGAADYASAMNEALTNDRLDPLYTPADIAAYASGSSPYLFPNVNWFDEVLRDNGVRSKMDLSFDGGNNIARYFAQVNYINDSGLFGPVGVNPDYDTQARNTRFGFRSNLDIDLTKEVLFQLNVGGNIQSLNRASADPDQIFRALYRVPSAAFPVRTASGAFGGTEVYSNNPYALLTATGWDKPNMRELILDGHLKTNLNQFLDGLSAEAAVGYNTYASYWEESSRSFLYESAVAVRDQTGAIVDTSISRYGETTGLNYWDSFGVQRRHADLLGKFNYDRTYGQANLGATLLFHQDSHVLNGQNQTYNRRNFAGNLHYGWNNKYFADVALSYSGNNLLPEGSKYNFYPAVSAAWVLSEEPFASGSAWLDYLKLRASWGMSGSDLLPTNNPDIQGYYSGNGYYFTNNNTYNGGFYEGQLATADFGPEISYKTNVGLDLNVLRALNFTADVFYARRTNILTSSEGLYSDVIGIGKPLATDGVVDNKGLELALDWRSAAGDFTYRLGGNFAFSRNEIIEMNEAYQPFAYLERTGRPVGQVFGLETVGFFESAEDIANSPRQEFSPVSPGDVKYRDQNGDGVIDEFDEVALGYATQYPEMYFGATLELGFKGFGIAAELQGTGNYTAYLNTPGVYWPLVDNNNLSTYYYENRWAPGSTTDATLPRLTTQANDNNYRSSDLWMVDRSYVKLRTLEVSYSLDPRVSRMWGVHNAQVYVQGRNLFSIDNIDVLDPEHLSAGYPLLKTYSLGIRIGF